MSPKVAGSRQKQDFPHSLWFEAAESIFAELGLNMTTAVNIFLRQTIRENGIPLSLKLNTPNEVIVAAIAEERRIASDPNVKGYKSLRDLREALDEV